MAAVASLTGVKIAAGAVVCKDSEIIGDVFIGPKTVVHIRARIVAEAGPIYIGENNLIEEQVQIIYRSENNQSEGKTMIIGNNNVFEVGSVSESLKIGDDNILESKARVGQLTELTNGCVIGAKCEINTKEIIPENTIIYGEKLHRRLQVCRPTAQTLQLDFLTRILPNYHYIRKSNVKAIKTEPGQDLKGIASFCVGQKMASIPDKSWQPPFVCLDTTIGEFLIELYWQHAPNSCRNFAELARRGYYNGCKFHRIIKDFMIQGGDPTATGRGGTSIYGKTFDDEIHDDLRHTGAGILSMANAGPNTNGSQFFITLAPAQWLDGKHSIFARVHSGMHVVQRVGLVETDSSDRPVDDVKIIRAEVIY